MRASAFGKAPRGWLSPALMENWHTPDLLKEEGYDYTCNWIHDEQPTWLATRSGRPLMTMPYPLEVNDLPAFVARHVTADDFARMIKAQFDQLYEDSKTTARVMGIALHPYIVGQPYRLRHLRRALAHLARARDAGRAWFTTPGAICDHMDALAAERPAEFG